MAMPSPTFYMANNDYDVLVQSHELERVPDINTVTKAAQSATPEILSASTPHQDLMLKISLPSIKERI